MKKKYIFAMGLIMISLFGLFNACKMDNKDVKLSKKEKEQQKINDITKPDTDVPAYEGFNNVRYESIVKYSDGRSKYACIFGEKAICKLGFTGSPGWCYVFPEYKVENGIILLDFSKQIELKKSITLQDIKDSYILELENWLKDLYDRLNAPNTEEKVKEQIRKQIDSAKRGIENLKAGKMDEEFELCPEYIRKHMQELSKINPIKVTVSDDKTKIVLEKYVVIDLNTGERSEYKDLEFVKK